MAKRSTEADNRQLTLAAIDHLRLDGQSREVSEAKNRERVAQEFVNGMIKYWGKYLSRELHENAITFPRRVIWTLGEDLAVFYDEFFTDIDETPNIASLNDLQEFFIEECGANWYSYDIMSKIGRVAVIDNDEMLLINYYSDLIKSHGEMMHQYFFGKLQHRGQKSKILTSVNEDDIHRLFGTSYGEMWGEEDRYSPNTYGTNFADENLVVQKSAIRIWQKPVRSGEEALRECDDSQLTKEEKLELVSFNNLTLGHELSHMFYNVARQKRKLTIF